MYRRSASPEIELFPFLSVLFCTIGTLILIIVLLVTQASGSQKNVTIIAKNDSANNQELVPRYIECQSDGIVIHPSQEFVAIEEFNKPRSALNRLLTEIKIAEKQYLIVAIKPDGVKVFQEIRELVEQQGIKLGYEPIDQDWQLKIKQQ